MKLLLDTHVWLWAVLEPERLSRRVARLFRTAQTELFLSPISLWEVLRLVAVGRLELGSDPGAWVRRAREVAPIAEVPLTHAAVLECPRIVIEHTDPADLLLAATARAGDLTLVTADRRLLAGRGFRTLAAS